METEKHKDITKEELMEEIEKTKTNLRRVIKNEHNFAMGLHQEKVEKLTKDTGSELIARACLGEGFDTLIKYVLTLRNGKQINFRSATLLSEDWIKVSMQDMTKERVSYYAGACGHCTDIRLSDVMMCQCEDL